MSAFDSDSESEDSHEPGTGVVRCDHCQKSAEEVGMPKLRFCSACSSAPYCSVECQRQNWKRHKIDCRRVTSGELMHEVLAQPIGDLGKGKRRGSRTMGQVLQDLAAWANVHNGDTLTVVAWQALGLLSDIEARKSKVLLLGLCRTPSSDPKTYYTLKEACVLSLSDLNQVFKNRRSVAHGNPGRILKENEKLRKSKDGAIGAVLVISVEQAEDDSRPVLEALGRTPVTWQPLGVFEEHRISFQKYGQFPEPLWKACLDNTLRGGIFAPTFHTS